MILAGDIGGTKTILAWFRREGERVALHKSKSYASRDHSSLLEIVRKFRDEFPAGISASAFGVAGPVIDGRSELTNLPWVVNGRELAAEFGIDSVSLLNDLEATAYGVLEIDGSENAVLNAGKRNPRGAMAVIAAGTGLGEAGLFWDGSSYRAIPSEGGNTDFAPRNRLEIELLEFLLKEHLNVYYELLVSGPGLQNIYRFLRARSGAPEPEWLSSAISSGDPAAVISQAAMESKDRCCIDALEMFVSLYGAEAGNLALKFLATGGLFIGGGIAPKILRSLQTGPFMKSFTAKSRYTKLLGNVPVSVILNDRAALLGAGHYAGMMER